MKPTLFALLLMAPLMAFSQSFMPAFSSGMETPKGKVILKSGETLSGTIPFFGTTKNIKTMTLKDENGEKHKIKGEDIEKVLLEVADLAVLTTETSSLKDMLNTGYKELLNADYFIWEPAVTPKRGKTAVMQLVNPGVDSKMKVYLDPMAQETKGVAVGGVQLTGGIEKSYYIVKAGAETAYKVEKGKYKKQFEEIFSDCPKMMEMLDGKKPDWDDFAAHVYLYDQVCD